VRRFSRKGRQRKVKVVGGWDVDRFPFDDRDGVEEARSWVDIREVLHFMWPQERVVLRLMREGKTPTDIATVLDFPRRQRAEEEMRRAVRVARFYLMHMPAVRKLCRGVLPLSRRIHLALRMYIVGRMGQREIAGVLGYGHRRALCTAMLRARRRLAIVGGHQDVLEVLRACSTRKSLRMRGRRLMSDEAWRKDLKETVLDELLGDVWYEWGAQKVIGLDAIHDRRADCSGFVLELLKWVDVLPKDYPDRTAQGLAGEYRTKTVSPKPGDLAFYGSSWKKVSHVMVYVGEVEGREDRVAGMCGGRRNMEAVWAAKVGAGCWLRSTRYRRDFLGYRRVT